MTSLIATLASTTQATGMAIIARGPRAGVPHYPASRAAARSDAVSVRPGVRPEKRRAGRRGVAHRGGQVLRSPGYVDAPPPGAGAAGTPPGGRLADEERAFITGLKRNPSMGPRSENR